MSEIYSYSIISFICTVFFRTCIISMHEHIHDVLLKTAEEPSIEMGACADWKLHMVQSIKEQISYKLSMTPVGFSSFTRTTSY